MIFILWRVQYFDWPKWQLCSIHTSNARSCLTFFFETLLQVYSEISIRKYLHIFDSENSTCSTQLRPKFISNSLFQQIYRRINVYYYTSINCTVQQNISIKINVISNNVRNNNWVHTVYIVIMWHDIICIDCTVRSV